MLGFQKWGRVATVAVELLAQIWPSLRSNFINRVNVSVSNVSPVGNVMARALHLKDFSKFTRPPEITIQNWKLSDIMSV